MKLWIGRGDRLTAVIFGVLYGIVTQVVARWQVLDGLYGVMSLGYVFVLPLILGVLTSVTGPPYGSRAEPPTSTQRSFWLNLGAALLTALLCLAFAFLVGWEGTICLLMAAPVYLTLSALGAVFGFFVRRRLDASARRMLLGPVLALPLLSAALESRVPLAEEVRSVSNSIAIAAPAERVWSHIARVSRIHEPQESIFFDLGFPRPIEATLSREGVGGVRHASFERGLLFLETVTHWQPPHELRFAIEVDASHTPLTTLDAHVTVGGRYFDVLEGGYRVEPRGPRSVLLHLTSRHRIGTHYNFYSSLWSDYLMSEIQTNILRVIRDRCERQN